MKDVLHPLCLAIAGTGFLFLLRDLLVRDPGQDGNRSRRDPALIALAFTYGFSALSYAVSLTWVWVRIDGFFGVPNIVVPIAQGFVIVVLALQAAVLAYWSRPPDRARRRTRMLLVAAVAVITAMAVLFTLLTPATTRPTDFSLYYAHDPVFQTYVLLYFGTYSVAETYLAVSCWRYARNAVNRSIAFSLRLVTVGAAITLVYSGIRIAAIIGAETGFSVSHLNDLAWACGDIGATLTQIGYLIPTVALRAAGVRRWATAHLRYRRLGPLWSALDQADPGITLRRPSRQGRDVIRGRSAHFPLLRRRVEIRQGQKLMRRYLDPAVRTRAEQRRAAEGLSGPEFAAAVTADQIHAALVWHTAGEPAPEPAEFADSELLLDTIDDELLHLQRVAAYFASAATPDPFDPSAPSAPSVTSATSGSGARP
ncbi:MAB_1171c family putative transporter [Streptomyces sp. SCSIO 30461]|uniref:MAB_1171c family putative transporter n=1 Tax=Streptomyces sp. SCSIO 30461 TaxID=3118085 RepID=UPI0030CE1379